MVINSARTYEQRTARGRPLTGEVETMAAGENGHAARWPELRAAVAALPERQRHVLFLRHYADLGYDEIGEVLGIARGTVSATLHAAHASLRRHMAEVTR